MAGDGEKRKNFWNEDEDTAQIQGLIPRSMGVPASVSIEVQINDFEMLLEQTHQLHQHYFNSIEKRPPIEKLSLLKKQLQDLQRASLQVTASRFRVNQVIQKYNAYSDLWDRKMKQMEKRAA